MDEPGLLRGTVRADTGENHRNTGADVLPEDDRNGRAEGDQSGGGERLQNTD